MKKVWLTESVLCSPRKEGGRVPQTIECVCAETYLRPQLKLFSKALVVALGRKAQYRLERIGVTNFLTASAVSPPGCNRPEACVSWEKIPEELKRRYNVMA